jgi:hypothetical protein
MYHNFICACLHAKILIAHFEISPTTWDLEFGLTTQRKNEEKEARA